MHDKSTRSINMFKKHISIILNHHFDKEFNKKFDVKIKDVSVNGIAVDDSLNTDILSKIIERYHTR